VGSAIRALWGQQWTRLPSGLADATSTATTGLAFADRLGWGAIIVPLRPVRLAANRMVRPNIGGCGSRAPLGAEMSVSAFFRQTRKYCPNGGMAFADRVGWGTITVPPLRPSWWPRTAWLSQKPRVRSSEVVECSQAGAPNLTSDRDGWKIQVRRVRTSFAMNVERAHRSVRETA
jgi:hypothetical protein